MEGGVAAFEGGAALIAGLGGSLRQHRACHQRTLQSLKSALGTNLSFGEGIAFWQFAPGTWAERWFIEGQQDLSLVSSSKAWDAVHLDKMIAKAKASARMFDRSNLAGSTGEATC